MRFPLIPISGLDDDECFHADQPTSIAFEIAGRPVYLLCEDEPDAYAYLKRAYLVTHKIAELEDLGGLYRCVLEGSDGSELEIHITGEDVYHNMRVTENVLDTQMSQMVC
jgi:hypothetical protein